MVNSRNFIGSERVNKNLSLPGLGKLSFEPPVAKNGIQWETMLLEGSNLSSGLNLLLLKIDIE